MRRSPYKPKTGFEIRGSHVIIAIILIAVAAASFPLVFKYYRDRNVLALWGPDVAQLIKQRADEIWLDVLKQVDPDTSPARRLEIGNETFAITESRNIAHAPGMLNARQTLIEKQSFAWGTSRGECEPRWEYALVFVSSETGNKATIAFDTQCGRARLLETGKEVALDARIAKALNVFVDERLKAPLEPAGSTEEKKPIELLEPLEP